MTSLSNAPESQQLNRQENEEMEVARNAMQELRKTFYTWLNIARAIRTLRRKADQIGGKFTFNRLLAQQGFSTESGPNQQLNKATVSLMLKIMEHEAEVVAWHTRLPEKLQREVASPSAVNARCRIINPKADDPTQQGAPKPERGPTEAEKRGLEIARLQEENDHLRREGGDVFGTSTDPKRIASIVIGNLAANPAKAVAVARHLLTWAEEVKALTKEETKKLTEKAQAEAAERALRRL